MACWVTGRQDHARSGFVMLSVPTLWTAFVVNFLALGLIWAYVMRSYPAFAAARFWTASAFAAAIGAAIAMLRVVLDSLIPLWFGGTMLVFAAGVAAMGIKEFYNEPVKWRSTALVTGFMFVGTALFLFGYDSETMRVAIYSPRPVAAAGDDAEIADVEARWAGQSRRPGSPAWSPLSSSPSMPPALWSKTVRRRHLVRSFQRAAVDHDPGADVSVDVLEFRFPADGDRPAAQRGRRSGAARRSHRRSATGGICCSA